MPDHLEDPFDHPLLSAVPTFAELGLSEKVIDALGRVEITTPTPVQAAVIPDAMSGRDVLGRAQTGSGKTLAFGLPILARLAGERSRPKQPRALIIVPTRELATQVRRSLEPLASAVQLKLVTVYGGTPYDRQIKQLRAGADIVVATPGRLQDLMDKGHCRTEDVVMTILDEADHLCDLGFYPAVDQLLKQTPVTGQRMLLSATLDGDVDRLVRAHLREPVLHELDPNKGAVATMDHHVLVVGGFRDKVEAATALIEANPRSIVFTRTREGATELAEAFGVAGIEAVDLHGNLSPAGARAEPAQVLLRQGAGRRRHRRGRPRHPRRQRRPGRALRPARRPQGLPAPLRPYGAGRRVRCRRLDHHAAPGRRDRPDAARAGVTVPAPRQPHHPAADDPRGARHLRRGRPRGAPAPGRLERRLPGQPQPRRLPGQPGRHRRWLPGQTAAAPRVAAARAVAADERPSYGGRDDRRSSGRSSYSAR